MSSLVELFTPNRQVKAEKAWAKSIAAAKRAGALYYTDKNGKVQAAVYAEDLKKPIRPKAKPKKTLTQSQKDKISRTFRTITVQKNDNVSTIAKRAGVS